MRLYIFVIFVYIGYTLATNSTPKECYDPDDEQDIVVLWKTLFTKLNILLVETAEIKHNFRDLEKRQEEQELQISKLMNSVNDNGTDVYKGLLEMNLRLDDLTKRQNTQEDLVHKFCKQSQEWTTILRRQDGTVDFYRNWTEYKMGFGNPPNGEFFIGLERLHALTRDAPHELMVVVKDWNNEMRYALYDHFKIGSEQEKYALKVLGNYSGDAGDSLDFHRGMLFSTFDQDNDESTDLECAKYRTGAWWYNNCYYSHLTGPYRKEENSKRKGIGWNAWYGQDYSFKFAEMKIRSKSL